MEWIRVMHRGELREGRCRLVSVHGEDIAIIRLGEDYFAVSNICPHQHFSRIHEGSLGIDTITCPMHGWTFDVRSGACRNGSGRLKTFELKVQGNDILLLYGRDE